MHAFISHASKNNDVAAELEKELEARGLEVWLDLSEIQLGFELQENIRASQAVLLLWSGAAAASRWVTTEWIMAIHEETFIVPCTLDETVLPQCLQNAVYLKVEEDVTSVADRLANAVKQAPTAANPLAPLIRSEEPALKEVIHAINQGQMAMLEQLQKRQQDEASELQRLVDGLMMKAEKAWQFDSMIANLGGYHR